MAFEDLYFSQNNLKLLIFRFSPDFTLKVIIFPSSWMTKSTFEVLRSFLKIHFYQDKKANKQHFYQEKTIMIFLIYLPMFTATSVHFTARSCQISVTLQPHPIIFYFRSPNS